MLLLMATVPIKFSPQQLVMLSRQL